MLFTLRKIRIQVVRIKIVRSVLKMLKLKILSDIQGLGLIGHWS